MRAIPVSVPRAQLTGSAAAAAAILQLGANNAIPYGPSKPGNVVVGYAYTGYPCTLDLHGYSANINGLTTTFTGSQTIYSIVDNLGTTPGTLTVGNDDATSTFAGVIQNTFGTLALTKAGSGTQVLSGSNTYTGPTTINTGELVIDGSLASPVTVNSDGTLGGTGHLSSVTVYSGGHIAPGDFNTSLILAANMDFEGGDLDIVGAGNSITSLSIAGNLILNGDPTLNFSGSLAPGTYTIASYGGTLSGDLEFNTLNIPTGDTVSYGTGSDSSVSLTVVPEPSTLAMLGVGAMGLIAYGWRRRQYQLPQYYSSPGNTALGTIGLMERARAAKRTAVAATGNEAQERQDLFDRDLRS